MPHRALITLRTHSLTALLAGWDEPRAALLERIRTLGGAARAPR